MDAPEETLNDTKPLTIKITQNYITNREISAPISPSISISPNLNSPSPPSSAFVSALQSPYISPRALEPPLPTTGTNTTTATTTSTTTTTIPSPISFSDDIPSSSHTPPYDFSTDPGDQKPRISFSFPIGPIPRVSFTKPPISPSSNAKFRSCDVYIGYHGQNLNLVRFCKWLKSELELQGIASFAADRSKYSNTQSHEIADRIICSTTVGVVVVTPSAFLNPASVEEIRFFAQKKNLVPVLFDTEISEIGRLIEERLDDKESREAFEGLTKLGSEYKLEANDSNWRNCVMKIVRILQLKLGRKSIAEREVEEFEEFPFRRSKYFVGREKELTEIEAAFFGCSNDGPEIEYPKPVLANGGSNGSSDGFADEESDTIRTNGKYISLDVRKCKEPTLEAWIEPVMDFKGRGLQRQRSKHKKSRGAGNKGYGNSNVVCINGIAGIGKTELAMEFAYRYSQRYKKVLWVGGEARYFRQNLLNLSMVLGLDVSAEAEKERGQIRSFEEQELDAFQRVKRELFRDVPYLLVIDNLETEKEWWEGKDLHDLIPKNTGATHVIVTTRLPKVMSFEPIQLPPLSLADSLILLKGKKKKDYPSDELEILRKFDERLGRLSFGLWVIGSLLSELFISPSALLEAIERISLNECSISEDTFSRNNPFLIKVLVFSFAVLDRAKSSQNLASRMLLAGAWFAPAPISSTLLSTAADKLPTKGNNFSEWGKFCCLSPQTRKNETDSALMIVKLGLARRSTKQPGCWIQFHPITQSFAKRRGSLPPAKATVQAVRKIGNASLNSDHLWASAFLVFGFKSEPPIVQLKPIDMVLFIKRTAIPLAIRSFMLFSRCNSALELLKVCTNVLEEVEKSFVSQIQDWGNGSLCWKKKMQGKQRVDEYVWQDVTLLKATLLETRAKLLLRGGHFDSGEELCRTCISIRTVMLGHRHAQTLAAQETLGKLVRQRSKI
ncbi:uncharacterized protein A4U43_C05F21250 [Asparagus officinalis]|uniref:AAA+ ATPase domain-containing protein n=1 Tax=Asparagus officinalis TaxID=4686 RepID=A0A5P1ETB6_ASPOF|nr:uncharacterized protein LOC109840151 [Asparagus officinalis]ONK69285.1 uncharacterized protein A4U43_C05F21250 [Asparagus officinalis]